MSLDFSVICERCRYYRHLGQRTAMKDSFGYGSFDDRGPTKAAAFIANHLYHNLRIVQTDNIPNHYYNYEKIELEKEQKCNSIY